MRTGGALNKQRESTYVEHFGQVNPMHVETTKARKRATMIERHGVEQFPSSPAFLEKRKVTWKERYGVIHNSQDPKINEKMRIAAAETISKKSAQHRFVSKGERFFHKLLQERFGEVRSQVRVYKWPIDFYVPSLDMYVQYDGLFWHGHTLTEEKLQKWPVILRKREIDQEQNEYFKREGLRLYRVSDAYAKGFPDSVLAELSVFDEIKGPQLILRLWK